MGLQGVAFLFSLATVYTTFLHYFELLLLCYCDSSWEWHESGGNHYDVSFHNIATVNYMNFCFVLWKQLLLCLGCKGTLVLKQKNLICVL